jgi:hypothetical protein
LRGFLLLPESSGNSGKVRSDLSEPFPYDTTAGNSNGYLYRNRVRKIKKNERVEAKLITEWIDTGSAWNWKCWEENTEIRSRKVNSKKK